MYSDTRARLPAPAPSSNKLQRQRQLHNSEAARDAAPRVADLMARQLSWTPRERDAQLADALRRLDAYGGQ